MSRLYNPFSQYIDTNSTVLTGGKATIYLANTTTPLEIFSDEDLVTPIPNPVTLDAKGALPADIYYADGTNIKILLETSAGVTYDTADNIPPIGDTASVFNYSANNTYAEGARALDSGIWYISNAGGNKANPPSTSSSKWTPEQYVRQYNAQFEYLIGNTTYEDGVPYRSRTGTTIPPAPNIGNTPSTSPAGWGNLSGIGLHTVNVPGGTLNLPDANPASSNSDEINNEFVVVTKEFDGSNDRNVQFSIDMPQSWDLGFLQVKYKLISRTNVTTVTGTNTAVFGISGVGFGDGDDIGGSSFGSPIQTLIAGISAKDSIYISESTAFAVANITSAESIIYFQVTRDAAGSTDPAFLAVLQTVGSGTELTLLTAAGTVQPIAKSVSITSAEDVSLSDYPMYKLHCCLFVQHWNMQRHVLLLHHHLPYRLIQL